MKSINQNLSFYLARSMDGPVNVEGTCVCESCYILTDNGFGVFYNRTVNLKLIFIIYYIKKYLQILMIHVKKKKKIYIKIISPKNTFYNFIK